MAQGRTKPPFASIERQLLTIPGRHGAYLQTSQKQPLVINQPIGFFVSDDVDALRLKDELASWLVTDEPAPLTFDDEPGRIYYAVVTNTIDDFEKFSNLRQGTIQFLCLDPYGYSAELTHNVTNNPTVLNEGTAETYPIFDVEILQPITRLEIKNKSLVDKLGAHPSIILGRAATIEQTKFIPEELVFQDSMQSTQTWQAASEIDNGYIAGEIGVDSKGFYPRLFGNAIEPYNWQGPSLQRGIGTSLQDFKADIFIENLNTAAETGMLAVYFRDANGNKIANIGFGDAWTEKAENFGHGQLGNYNSGPRQDAYADYAAGWNNFSGVIRVIREDNVWRFYYAQLQPDGKHVWVHSRSRIADNARQFMAPVTSIQVAFRLWPASDRTNMHIKSIKIYKLNKRENNQETKAAFLAQAGDKFTIDTKQHLILKNGELATDMADLALLMFPFAKGQNALEVIPNGAVQVNARFKKAYL